MQINALVCALGLSVFVSGALAFDAAAPDAVPAPTTKTHDAASSEDAGARTARSIECSQRADAQNLHGKPRKHFMRECKHGV